MLTWLPNFTPSVADTITQASGLCFTAAGEVVLVEDQKTGELMLPGGHPEGQESLEATLVREVFEEACAVVEQTIYLGAQGVDDGIQTHYQTRFWASVRLEPFKPRFETSRRLMVKPSDFVSSLDWSTRRLAKAMLRASLDVQERSRGIR